MDGSEGKGEGRKRIKKEGEVEGKGRKYKRKETRGVENIR